MTPNSNKPATTLHGPGDLLATIPSLMGYTPRDSVVVISIRVAGEIGVILRVDRVDLLNDETEPPLGRSVRDHLERDGARVAVLVSYTTDDVRLADPAIDRLRTSIGTTVREVEGWVVNKGRFFSPGCARDSCCPANGRPLPAPIVAHAVRTLGTSAHRPPNVVASLDFATFTTRYTASPADKTAVTKALLAATPVDWTDVGSRRAAYTIWETAVTQASTTPTGTWTLPQREAATLIANLQSKRMRDAILVYSITGDHNLARGILDGTRDDDVSEVLHRITSPDGGTRPDPAVVAPTIDVLAYLHARTPDHAQAPLYTLAGIHAWWDGSTNARPFIDAAQTSEPKYRLAGLIGMTLLAGIEPGWVHRAARETATAEHLEIPEQIPTPQHDHGPNLAA